MASCARHPFDRSVGTCQRCDDPVCSFCVVQARRAVFCLDCALAAAGIRVTGRSGKAAAGYRRRLNEEMAAELAEIDLRDGARTVGRGRRRGLVRR